MFMQTRCDSLNPAIIVAGRGDLIACDEFGFVFDKGTSQDKFLFKINDSLIYVNDKICFINIPENDNLLPFFADMEGIDFSALQFINFSSKPHNSYIPYLTRLSKIKPWVGLWFQGNFGELEGMLKIFKPKVICGPTLTRGDYDLLSTQTGLEILLIHPGDSVINEPLPPIPLLKQIFLTDIGTNAVLTNDFLSNNRQIERVIIQKGGSLDLALLNPLINLRELVINDSDTIINPDLLNNHKQLELLSVTGDETGFNPALIDLPNLRWMTFSPHATQDEFNSFINNHPDIEFVELLANDTISSLQAISQLNKLAGLTITDTVTDIASIKNLKNLKYLSLPADYLDDTLNKSDIQRSLPNTRIAANEGFCLGSGWILLLVPLVLLIRFFAMQEKHIR